MAQLSPPFFIYDRSANLDEGDDVRQSVLYPLYDMEDRQHNVEITYCIRPIIMFLLKMEMDIGNSPGRTIQLAEHSYSVLNVGKYSLVLISSACVSPGTTGEWLRLMHLTYRTLYNDFKTAHQHTTNELRGVNPDKGAELIDVWAKIYSMVKSYSSVEALGKEVALLQHYRPARQVLQHLHLLLEAVCSSTAVLGALILYDGQILIQNCLSRQYVLFLRIFLTSNVQGLGQTIEVEGYNTSVYKCFVRAEDIVPSAGQTWEECPHGYVILHIRPGSAVSPDSGAQGSHNKLTLTLIVRRESDDDETLWNMWRRPSRSIKNSLVHIGHELSVSFALANPSSDHLRVHRDDPLLFGSLSSEQSLPNSVMRSVIDSCHPVSEEPDLCITSMELIHHTGFSVEVNRTSSYLDISGHVGLPSPK